MKVTELKEALSARGLSTAGKKQDLQGRLLEAQEAAAPAPAPAPAAAAPAAPADEGGEDEDEVLAILEGRAAEPPDILEFMNYLPYRRVKAAAAAAAAAAGKFVDDFDPFDPEANPYKGVVLEGSPDGADLQTEIDRAVRMLEATKLEVHPLRGFGLAPVLPGSPAYEFIMAGAPPRPPDWQENPTKAEWIEIAKTYRQRREAGESADDLRVLRAALRACGVRRASKVVDKDDDDEEERLIREDEERRARGGAC
jgi:hypothetical protein